MQMYLSLRCRHSVDAGDVYKYTITTWRGQHCDAADADHLAIKGPLDILQCIRCWRMTRGKPQQDPRPQEKRDPAEIRGPHHVLLFARRANCHARAHDGPAHPPRRLKTRPTESFAGRRQHRLGILGIAVPSKNLPTNNAGALAATTRLDDIVQESTNLQGHWLYLGPALIPLEEFSVDLRHFQEEHLVERCVGRPRAKFPRKDVCNSVFGTQNRSCAIAPRWPGHGAVACAQQRETDEHGTPAKGFTRGTHEFLGIRAVCGHLHFRHIGNSIGLGSGKSTQVISDRPGPKPPRYRAAISRRRARPRLQAARRHRAPGTAPPRSRRRRPR